MFETDIWNVCYILKQMGIREKWMAYFGTDREHICLLLSWQSAILIKLKTEKCVQLYNFAGRFYD